MLPRLPGPLHHLGRKKVPCHFLWIPDTLSSPPTRYRAERGDAGPHCGMDEHDPDTGQNMHVHVQGLNMPVALSDEPAEPDYVLPPQTDKQADFVKVVGGRVVASELGYRLIGESRDEPCLAVRRVEPPATGRVTLKAKLSVPEAVEGNRNGFIVFGDGEGDETLVKCGVRIRQKKAQIVQGPLKNAVRTQGVSLEVSAAQDIVLTIDVDLAQQVVTLTANGVTVDARFARPLTSITHVGLCTDRATCDFAPLQLE